MRLRSVLTMCGYLGLCTGPTFAESVQESFNRINAEEVERVRSELSLSASVTKHLKPAALIAKAKERMLADLKDPDSAKFRNIHVREVDGAKFVCGEMNAKNGYGGYIGFARFLTDGDKVEIAATDTATPYQINLTIAGIPFGSTMPSPALDVLCK